LLKAAGPTIIFGCWICIKAIICFFVIIATKAGPKNLEKTGSCLKTPPSRRTPRRRCHRSLTAAMFLARSRP
jgi:hypothetical protein